MWRLPKAIKYRWSFKDSYITHPWLIGDTGGKLFSLRSQRLNIKWLNPRTPYLFLWLDWFNICISLDTVVNVHMGYLWTKFERIYGVYFLLYIINICLTRIYPIGAYRINQYLQLFYLIRFKYTNHQNYWTIWGE